MDQNERSAIDGLFGKLRQLDRQAASRDTEAETHIAQQVATLPAAPYYMAQALLVQEQALANLQNRIQELERAAAQRPAAGGGGFLGGLFGGGATTPAAPPPPPAPRAQGPIPPQYMQPAQAAAPGSPWGRPAGGGFLAGAMQTAMGVAGGMLIADAISSAFHSGTAEAAQFIPEAPIVEEVVPEPVEPDPVDDVPYDDYGSDPGGYDESI